MARDLALRVDNVPGSGGTTAVRELWEMLGGKGANKAVALAQLGIAPALVAVLGDDDTGTSFSSRLAGMASIPPTSCAGGAPGWG